MRVHLLALLAIGAAVAVAAGGVHAAPAAPTPVVIKDKAGASFTGDAAAGEKIFARCAVCHKLKSGINAIGPSLYGVVGRKAGSAVGFNYSPAIKASNLVWTEQVLSEFLENPRAKIPGTKMTFVGLSKAQDRANVIAHIKQAGAAN